MALSSATVEQSASLNFVDALVERQRRLADQGRPVLVSWLNHFSIRVALTEARTVLPQLDVCGIDGQLLRLLLRHPFRTSADLIAPLLLEADPEIETVLTVGGSGDRSDAIGRAICERIGRSVRVVSIDGYDGLLRGAALQRLVREVEPQLLLVGLGAGLQEQVLVEASVGMNRGYALTCGGFLDQVLQQRYYPDWAYPLRLNWLVRLAREPRRLWRRYSTHAVAAVVRRSAWRAAMLAVPGLLVHAQMCAGERAGVRER